MYAKMKRTEKTAMVYFKVISWHSPGMTKKNHKSNLVMVADDLIKYQTRDLLNISQVCHS